MIDLERHNAMLAGCAQGNAHSIFCGIAILTNPVDFLALEDPGVSCPEHIGADAGLTGRVSNDLLTSEDHA